MPSSVRRVLLPLGTAIVFLLLWQFGVTAFGVASYLIPTPVSVLASLWQGLVGGAFWPDIGATLLAILSGYVVGCASALVCAAFIGEFSMLEEALYPLIVAFQSVPKVALAPVVVVWFGFDLPSKVVLVALICFFPCFVNTLTGLKATPGNLIDLYRAFGASRLQVFWNVKVPAALGAIFAGLEISVVLALLGAIVAEFVASRRGLGHVIEAASSDFNVATMFASIVILAVIGVGLTQIIAAVRRRVAFWEAPTSTVTVEVTSA